LSDWVVEDQPGVDIANQWAEAAMGEAAESIDGD
jgi:hypothetical protein